MKFLITGKIHQSRGPRAILTLALLFIALFVAAHFLRDALTLGLSPERIARNADPGITGADRIAALLEELHVDLFLYAMTLLTVSASLFELRLSASTKKFVVYAMHGFVLAALTARGTAGFAYGGALAFAILNPAAHLLLLVAIATALVKIHGRSEI